MLYFYFRGWNDKTHTWELGENDGYLDTLKELEHKINNGEIPHQTITIYDSIKREEEDIEM